jgi:hypothetical protein
VKSASVPESHNRVGAGKSDTDAFIVPDPGRTLEDRLVRCIETPELLHFRPLRSAFGPRVDQLNAWNESQGGVGPLQPQARYISSAPGSTRLHQLHISLTARGCNRKMKQPLRTSL